MQTKDKIKSKYFDFNNLQKSKIPNSSEYKGWSGLSVIKFDIKKKQELNDKFIDSHYGDFCKKEKILVVASGKLEIKNNKEKRFLEKFDAIDFVTGIEKYEIVCLEDSIIFMISSKNLENYQGETVFFNFKKNIESRDLWGGQCISRPYEGKGLTLVLFDLKPGFKFEDKGHPNEQITWVTTGSMNFYADGNKQKIKPNVGVDIGPNHIHGGISDGAMGFDAFFPKRQEIKYKKN
jgi:quercetin dioxygenase-like cupin family protein